MCRINRRVVWATCCGLALVAASTLAMLGLVSTGWGGLSNPETGPIQLGMGALTFAGLFAGTFAGSSALAFTSIGLAGVATERRRTPERRAVSMDVVLVTDGGSCTALSKNISASGIFVTTDRACTVGERLQLQFQLAGQESRFSVEAEVRWVCGDAPIGVGLLFIEPPGPLKAAIQRFLATGRRQRSIPGRG
jgi:Tfp pilus assembly protein PilZ